MINKERNTQIKNWKNFRDKLSKPGSYERL